MRHSLIPVLLASFTIVACAPSQTDEKTPAKQETAAAPFEATSLPPEELEAIKQRLNTNLKGVKVDDVRTTPLPGVYEIQSGMNFGYVSADGRYLIEGDLNDIVAGKSLTEERRRVARADLIGKFSGDQAIEYAPANGPAKYTVTVFTDIDCGYCRKLHSHIAEYNADGIAVRYLFFPRSGPDTESFHKAEKVWCAADRKAALTQAKLGPGYEGDMSCKNPVAEQLKLAGQLGLRGTPAIVLPDGELIPGYQTPEQLLKVLAEHAAAKAPAVPAG
ncbi:MAG: DsbC family protein [Panacagrimonas sp.]|jgi:thiol:disulfide interchange protein DsbC|nr:DsbC family protein [Panacagrimonas sp.]MCC2656603.1 DsbC family protein [Panacagrimonas sp.]